MFGDKTIREVTVEQSNGMALFLTHTYFELSVQYVQWIPGTCVETLQKPFTYDFQVQHALQKIIWVAYCEQKILGSRLTRVALVAQSVEHQTFNLRVVGSSPIQGGQFLKSNTENVCLRVN